MSTPAYFAPFISPTAGLVLPPYQSIINDLISGYKAIYPQVVYLGTDTAKYQEISIFALKVYDCNLASQLAYNARSPLTAVGADLDSIVKMNGIARLPASYSTAPETITGVAGTIITNGILTDTQGNSWSLPITVTIPNSGSVTVGITCQTAGSIQAQIGSITTISGGATAGWTGATNPSPALPGLPVESDSQLRARQALSVASPSLTRLAGTISAIAAVPGVTRYATGIKAPDSSPGSSIENPTGGIDYWGTMPVIFLAVPPSRPSRVGPTIIGPTTAKPDPGITSTSRWQIRKLIWQGNVLTATACWQDRPIPRRAERPTCG